MLQPEHELEEFRIVRVLGDGGFGITYLAWDMQLDGPVAIKEYFPGQFAQRIDGVRVAAKSPAQQELYEWGYNKFFEEAQLLSKLRHNNIVAVRRVLKANNTLYLVMEFLEGEPLSSLISKEGKISEAEWLPWFFALCDGLKQVHRKQVLHRDIKPENIMICADAEDKPLPVFIDFGAARPSTVGTGKAVTTIATPGYAPIEQQAEDNQPQGPFTDIYALACTSLEALTGVAPDDALKSRILNDRVPQLLEKQRGVLSDRVIDALAWGLQLYSHERPQSLDEWLAAFKDGAAVPGPAVHSEAGAQTHAERAQQGQGLKEGGVPPSAKPAPQPLPVPETKTSGIKVLLGIAGALGAIAAGVLLYDPGLLEQAPDAAAQRVNACASISVTEQTLPSIRCYRAVLDDYPDESAARQGEINGVEHLFTQVDAAMASAAYGEAMAGLETLERVDADQARVDLLRQEILSEVTRSVERAIERKRVADARTRLEELRRLGGIQAELARLEQAIADVERAEQRLRSAFAECRGLRDAASYGAAYECYTKLLPSYPEAAQERADVKAELVAKIDALLTSGQLDAAEAQLLSADKLGIDTTASQKRLQTLRAAEKAAQVARAERERRERAERQKNEAILADRRRPTYGFALSGKFEETSRGTVFAVEGLNDALSRLIPIARGDVIERVDGQRLKDLDRVRARLQSQTSYVEDFSAGVPDSRVIDELILRKLDVNPGDIKFRIRRNGTPESIFCKNRGSIQCSGN